MSRQVVLILIIIFSCLFGCSETDKTDIRGTRDVVGIDSQSGMIGYLKGARLPALKSVESWPNKYGDGLIITTEHYKIFTTLLEPLMLSQVPGFMESAYRSYQNQLPEPVETRAKFRVYLFAERAQWEDFTKSFTGRRAPMYLKLKAGAYYLKDACVAYNIGRERTFSVLGHEGWHQFNKRHFKFRLPSWLDEGVAMLFESSREEKGFFKFEPGKNMYRLGALRQTLAKNKMIPLRKLIAMNPGEVLAEEEDGGVAAFYSQSYALVRFLREDDYGKRLADYHQMMLGGLDGDWMISETDKIIAADRNIPLTIRWNRAVGVQLFEQYISEDFEKIEKEYAAFCRKMVYHIRLRTQD